MNTMINRPAQYTESEIVSRYYTLLEAEDLTAAFRENLPRNAVDRQALYSLAANRHFDVQDAMAALLWQHRYRYRALLMRWGSNDVPPEALDRPGRQHLAAMLPRMKEVLYRLVPHIINDQEYDQYKMHPLDQSAGEL